MKFFNRGTKTIIVLTNLCLALNHLAMATANHSARATLQDNICNLVFVYGTLKRGEPNHHWLADADNGRSTFVCSGVTADQFPLVIASRYNIPYLLNAPGKGKRVEGELYEVDSNMLSQLDVLEDHPKYYRREIRQITTTAAASSTDVTSTADARLTAASPSSTVSAWVYLLHTFKPAMLDLPMLTSYSAWGDHGLEYITRYLRDEPGPEYWTDVKE